MLPRPRTARLLALSLLLASTLANAACQAQDVVDGNTIRLAVTDLQGLEELQREFGAFEAAFEAATDLEVEFFAVPDRVAATVALDAGQVDLVFTGPAEYVVMNARTDAVPVVAIRRPGYHSCIYTRKDSGIATVGDLAGTMVGMSDLGSTSGHLGPSQLLVDAGLTPGEDVEVRTLGDSVHEALRRGDIAAVGVGCHDYEEYMAKDDPTQYTVLVEGEPLPPDVIVARPGLPTETVARVKQGFEDNWDTLLAAILVGEDNQKYREAELVLPEDSDYDVVRSMYRAVGVDDFTAFVGD